MKPKDVYLTFKTDEATSEMLKFIAHAMKKSQPELINQICKEYIQDLNDLAEMKFRDEGYTTEQIYPTK